MVKSLVWSAPLLLLFVLMSGCDSGNKPLNSVRGNVSFHGTPLKNGTVVFIPDASRGGNGSMPRGELQSDGTFTLNTDGIPGAPAGWYRVTVVSIDPGKAVQGKAKPAPRSLIPAKYQDPEMSGLSCEVKEGKENQINFNLD